MPILNKIKTAVITSALILFTVPYTANATPTLWAVDEDDGQLFTLDDWDSNGVFTDYGQLKYVDTTDNNTVKTFPDQSGIEALTLDPNGIIYVAIDETLSGITRPSLGIFDINTATTTGDNIVNIIGQIGTNLFDDGGDNLTGLSFDPLTGGLWGLLKDDLDQPGEDGVEPDKIFYIADPLNNPQNITNIFTLEDLNNGNKVLNAEDFEFDEYGNLFVVDTDFDDFSSDPGVNDFLYEINLTRDGSNAITGISGVTELFDLNGIFSELPGSNDNIKIEAISWDFDNNRLIGSSDLGDVFVDITPGQTPQYLGALNTSGLTDVEGIDFVPVETEPEPVPEPITILGTMTAFGFGKLFKDKKSSQK